MLQLAWCKAEAVEIGVSSCEEWECNRWNEWNEWNNYLFWKKLQLDSEFEYEQNFGFYFFLTIMHFKADFENEYNLVDADKFKLKSSRYKQDDDWFWLICAFSAIMTKIESENRQKIKLKKKKKKRKYAKHDFSSILIFILLRNVR